MPRKRSPRSVSRHRSRRSGSHRRTRRVSRRRSKRASRRTYRALAGGSSQASASETADGGIDSSGAQAPTPQPGRNPHPTPSAPPRAKEALSPYINKVVEYVRDNLLDSKSILGVVDISSYTKATAAELDKLKSLMTSPDKRGWLKGWVHILKDTSFTYIQSLGLPGAYVVLSPPFRSRKGKSEWKVMRTEWKHNKFMKLPVANKSIPHYIYTGRNQYNKLTGYVNQSTDSDGKLPEKGHDAIGIDDWFCAKVAGISNVDVQTRDTDLKKNQEERAKKAMDIIPGLKVHFFLRSPSMTWYYSGCISLDQMIVQQPKWTLDEKNIVTTTLGTQKMVKFDTPNPYPDQKAATSSTEQLEDGEIEEDPEYAPQAEAGSSKPPDAAGSKRKTRQFFTTEEEAKRRATEISKRLSQS